MQKPHWEAPSLREGVLERVRSVGRAEPLHGEDGASLGPHGQGEAGRDRPSVEEHAQAPQRPVPQPDLTP